MILHIFFLILALLLSKRRPKMIVAGQSVSTSFRAWPWLCDPVTMYYASHLKLLDIARWRTISSQVALSVVLKNRWRFICAEQSFTYNRPAWIFGKVTVSSQILALEGKYAYFLHEVRSASQIIGTGFAKIAIFKGDRAGSKGNKKDSALEFLEAVGVSTELFSRKVADSASTTASSTSGDTDTAGFALSSEASGDQRALVLKMRESSLALRKAVSQVV